MTEARENNSIHGDTAGGAQSESSRGVPVVKPKAGGWLRGALPTVVLLVAVTLGAGGGWYMWHRHVQEQEAEGKNAGNVASKTSVGSARNGADGSMDRAQKLGAEGKDPAPGSAPGNEGAQVPAIVQENHRGAGAQPVPVRPYGQNGVGQYDGEQQGERAAPRQPRSRYDAPMSFALNNPASGPASGNQPLTGQSVQQPGRSGNGGNGPSANGAGVGARPDYSVPAAMQAQALSAVSTASPEKGALNLNTMKTPLAQASLIGNRDFILSKGAAFDCDTDTAINSSNPGMVRCMSIRDVWSDNGRVVLIERGSIMTGEYKANLQVGQTRIDVVWNRIKTTKGVVVDLASPATDALGRAGVDGEVDNHWVERFGAAFLLSTVKDVIAYETAAHGNNAATTGYSFSNTSGASETMANTILKQSINIPPTVTRPQGTRIKIFVARDLDFSKVYALQQREKNHDDE